MILNAKEYRDKVYGCMLGKNIGGTLGGPLEGQTGPFDLTFYTTPKGAPLPNDDLDLQLVWLKCLEERGPFVDAQVLAEYWLSYIWPDWNEYGIGKANMRLGFSPPVSGDVNNPRWRHSNGAWIRSEIWACLAPGCPSLAARLSYHDTIVDHGTGEGVYAELFTASLEAAAFVESDVMKIIDVGLSMVPAKSYLAR
ncbi:MAG: ADP-ribosylglycohydrolase family protein, partial [Planctomycetia bacterium]|nr:ADP-ribosylglycohydrolase family protein [Planctomycetia bacterium]